MSEQVNKLISIMARQLEQRAQIPAADIWPCERADITKTFDYTGPYLINVLYEFFSKYPKSTDISKLASCFSHPARLAYLCYLFTSRPTDKGDVERRVIVAERIIACISYLRQDDPFLESHAGNNLIFRPMLDGTIQELEDLDYLCDIHPQTEKFIRWVFAALATLIEHTYFAWMGAGREYHGIYDYKEKSIFVRDFYELRVPHWEFSKKLPWNSLRFVTIESNSAEMFFDFNGRAKRMNSKMKKIALLKDDKLVRSSEFEKEILSIFEVLRVVLANAVAESNQMSSEELLLQFAHSQFYTVHRACKKSNFDIDACMPDEIAEQILKSKGKPSGFENTKQKLMETMNSDERYRLLYDFLHPSNLEKL